MKAYKKNVGYSYAIGVFATLELLQHKPDKIIRIFISSKGNKNKGLDKIKVLSQSHNIPIEIADGLINKLSNSKNCYAIGMFEKFDSPLKAGQNQIVLVNPSDMGNLGTIIRTMVGFGVNNLAIIRPGVDIFDPKVIRASQGAVFQINFGYFNSFDQYQKSFPQNLYPFLLNGQKSVKEVEFKNPYSLIFGNEGAGLGEEFKNIEASVFIPHSGKIDSLNLAVAVGIGLYQAED